MWVSWRVNYIVIVGILWHKRKTHDKANTAARNIYIPQNTQRAHRSTTHSAITTVGPLMSMLAIACAVIGTYTLRVILYAKLNGSAHTMPSSTPHGATKCSAANNIALSRVVQMIAVRLARQIICLRKIVSSTMAGRTMVESAKSSNSPAVLTGIVMAPVVKWGKACSSRLVAPNAPAAQTSVITTCRQKCHPPASARYHWCILTLFVAIM